MTFLRNLIVKFNSEITFDFRNNSFDFIRLFLSLLVVFYHASLYTGIDFYGKAPFYFSFHYWDNSYFHVGQLAVFCFFSISGFLITKSIIKAASFQDFLHKRINRIYPAFLVSLFFSAFVSAPIIIAISGKNVFSYDYFSQSLSYFFRGLFCGSQMARIGHSYRKLEYT